MYIITTSLVILLAQITGVPCDIDSAPPDNMFSNPVDDDTLDAGVICPIEWNATTPGNISLTLQCYQGVDGQVVPSDEEYSLMIVDSMQNSGIYNWAIPDDIPMSSCPFDWEIVLNVIGASDPRTCCIFDFFGDHQPGTSSSASPSSASAASSSSSPVVTSATTVDRTVATTTMSTTISFSSTTPPASIIPTPRPMPSLTSPSPTNSLSKPPSTTSHTSSPAPSIPSLTESTSKSSNSSAYGAPAPSTPPNMTKPLLPASKKIGVGVGVGAGGLATLGLFLGYLILRRRRKKREREALEKTQYDSRMVTRQDPLRHEKTELEAPRFPAIYGRCELEGTEIHEVPASSGR